MHRSSHRRLLGWILFAVFAGVWFSLLRPAAFGGDTSYVIVAGSSMQPGMRGGDLAIVQRHDQYQVGDVVAYRVSGHVVIHRIVGGSAANGYEVRGDNNPGPDPWRPGPAQIIGARRWLVPYVGRAVAWSRSPLAAGCLVGGLTMFLILSAPSRKAAPKPLDAA